MPIRAALLVADENQQVAATPLLGQHYEIHLLYSDIDLSNRAVVVWPNGRDVSDLAQQIANLPRSEAQPVKLLRGDKQPSEFPNVEELKEWAAENVQIIYPNSSAPALSGVSDSQQGTHPPSGSSSLSPELPAACDEPPVAADDPGAGEPYGIPYWARPPEDNLLERSSVFVLNEDETNWPEPVDITSAIYVGLPLKLDMLPEALRDFVIDESASKGTDPAITAFAALAACAGVANDAHKLQVLQNDPRWLVRACIWPIVVGHPSSGKTPAIESCMAHAQRLDAELCRGNIAKLKQYDYEMKQFAEKERIAIKNGDPRPEEPEHPEIEQIWLDKATMEGARDVLQYSKRGVLWYRDEWSGAIAELDRYSKKGGGSGDRQRFLKLFDGGLDKQNLAGHRTIVLENWSAVVCGGIQPSAIVKYLGELENDGLLQRTLICMARPKKPGRDQAPDWASMERFKSILSVLRMGHGECVLRMSDEAAEIRRQFVAHISLRIKYEPNMPLASHMGKWEGYCSRLMLLYHLIDLAARGQQPGPNERISADTARQVVSFFLDFQLSHLQEFWNELMNEKEDRSFAQTIARWILANPGVNELLIRDHVSKPHWNAWCALKPWQRKEAMSMLVNLGWLAETGGRRTPDGISTRFKVNPRIKEIFAELAEEEKRARAMRKAELDAVRAQYQAMRDC